MSEKPICLFDSGVGGLTVLKKILDKFPNENYIYLADLANVPFGDKSEEEIKLIATRIIEWFYKFNPKVIIMACNTSSAILGKYQSESSFSVPTFGIIKPIASEIANSSIKKISVWATNLTVKSSAYKKEINTLNPNILVEEISCPKLVPMIEDLNFNSEDKEKIINEYLLQTSKDSESLIWGCTHYPLIENHFKKLSGMKTLDPASSLINVLVEKNIFSNSLLSSGEMTLYATAQKEKLEMFSKLYLQRNLTVKKIQI